MDNFKNHKEDKDLFPYEYGASSYDHMRESIFALLRREELASSKLFTVSTPHKPSC